MTHRLLFGHVLAALQFLVHECSPSSPVALLSTSCTSPHATFRERKTCSFSGEGEGKCDNVIQSFFKINCHSATLDGDYVVVLCAAHRPTIIKSKKWISSWWTVEDVLSLAVWGVNLLCSLVVQQQILLYLLADGSGVNRLWLGGCCIFGLCADISLHWCHWCFVDGTSNDLGGCSHPL